VTDRGAAEVDDRVQSPAGQQQVRGGDVAVRQARAAASNGSPD
jgi:hypothetical protein